jgi:hypothetical protein
MSRNRRRWVGVLVLATVLLAGAVGHADAQERRQKSTDEELRRRAPERTTPREGQDTAESQRRDPRDRGRDGDKSNTGGGTKANAGRLPDPPDSSDQSPGAFTAPDPGFAPALPPTAVWYEEEILLDCEDTWVCAVDELDSYYAWMLVRQTSIPWQHFVARRADGMSWRATLEDLEIEPWEAYAAVAEDEPRSNEMNRALSDPVLRALAKAHLAGITLPKQRCELPIVLEGVSAAEASRRSHSRDWVPLDSIDREIAERIQDETGWCFDTLLDAREFLGTWARTAKTLYLSPFIFEASFGIDLSIRWLDSSKRAEYPLDAQIRQIVEDDDWPEYTLR